jgi:hypothetical protein|eukprot:Tamp_20063.p1 GENE.Tamp_20063~~Tamp_20063.p1  ORF type:complete len:264 (-),score=24.95 Tamp_20063:298-1089(-)
MEYILWRIVGVPGWRPDAEYGKGRERMREALDAFEQSAFRVPYEFTATFLWSLLGAWVFHGLAVAVPPVAYLVAAIILMVLAKMARAGVRAHKRTGRNYIAIACDHCQAPVLLVWLVSALGAGCWWSCSGVVANPLLRSCCAAALNALVAAFEPLEYRGETLHAKRARRRLDSFEFAVKNWKPGEAAPVYDTSRLQFRCACCRDHECGAEQFYKCDKCRIVRYCSRECQKRHRARHKSECEAVQTGEIPRNSATRPLLHGEFR